MSEHTLPYEKKELLNDNGDYRVLRTDGSMDYFNKSGQIHRDRDEPAEIWKCGTRVWRIHGVKHREGGNPAVIHSDGREEYFYNGIKQDPYVYKMLKFLENKNDNKHHKK
jgi:hypothetical protein